MHLYCNYAAEHWANDGENPPVGLILCAENDAAVAHYALENLPNKILAAEYRMTLPAEKTLATEIENTRKMLENRAAARRKGSRNQVPPIVGGTCGRSRSSPAFLWCVSCCKCLSGALFLSPSIAMEMFTFG